MLWARTKIRVTTRTATTPGIRKADKTGVVDSPPCSRETSGTATAIQPISSTAITDMTRKVTCQPITRPRRVPTGMPSARASGMPAMTTAIALPCRFGGARRRA